jgi:hypothetical protein
LVILQNLLGILALLMNFLNFLKFTLKNLFIFNLSLKWGNLFLKCLSINRITFKNFNYFVLRHGREQARNDLIDRYALFEVNLKELSYKISRNFWKFLSFLDYGFLVSYKQVGPLHPWFSFNIKRMTKGTVTELVIYDSNRPRIHLFCWLTKFQLFRSRIKISHCRAKGANLSLNLNRIYVFCDSRVSYFI